MKKAGIVLLSMTLLLAGCSSKPEEEEYTGPVVTEETETEEERELKMIQECVEAYNTGDITQIETDYNTSLPPLPLELTSLPEVNSLSDLDVFEDDTMSTNTIYAGSYTVLDRYQVVFRIFKAKGSFWSNGQIEFRVNPGILSMDDPQFATYKQTLDSLLSQSAIILNGLYGIDVTKSEEQGPQEGYYAVTSVGPYQPKTIDDLKAIAETVFSKDYLETTVYPAVFEGENSQYKEIDGQLYCADSLITSYQISSYDTSYIVAVQEQDSLVLIDLLSQQEGSVQPILKRIILTNGEEGYRLSTAY